MSDLVEQFLSRDRNVVLTGDMLNAIRAEIERLRAQLAKTRHALQVLLNEATSFSVSGVYFDEECMGHKGPELARAALTDD